MTSPEQAERKLLLEKLEKIVRETIIHEEPYLSKGWSYNGLNALADFILADRAKAIAGAEYHGRILEAEALRPLITDTTFDFEGHLRVLRKLTKKGSTNEH